MRQDLRVGNRRLGRLRLRLGFFGCFFRGFFSGFFGGDGVLGRLFRRRRLFHRLRLLRRRIGRRLLFLGAGIDLRRSFRCFCRSLAGRIQSRRFLRLLGAVRAAPRTGLAGCGLFFRRVGRFFGGFFGRRLFCFLFGRRFFFRVRAVVRFFVVRLLFLRRRIGLDFRVLRLESGPFASGVSGRPSMSRSRSTSVLISPSAIAR